MILKASKYICNNRVPNEIINEITNKGYTLISDENDSIGVPDVLLSCLSGETLCYLSYTRQIRDILLGAIISKTPSGYATDWKGNSLGWPETPRLPKGVFGCNPNTQDIYLILKKHAQ